MKYVYVLGLFAFFACSSVLGEADASIECFDDDFDCYKLEPGHVVLKESSPSEIFYRDKVVSLTRTSTKVIRRTDPIAESPGHTAERRDSGKGIVVTVTEEIQATSCWIKNDSGVWSESQSCCGGESNIKVSITDDKETTLLIGRKHFGL